MARVLASLLELFLIPFPALEKTEKKKKWEEKKHMEAFELAV